MRLHNGRTDRQRAQKQTEGTMTQRGDILDLIDSAIDDYSISGDAMRCTPNRQTLQSPATWQVERLTPEQREAVLAGFRELASRMAVAVGQVIEMVNEVASKMRAAGLIPPPQPVDPMQRALEARRNRNTGPQVRQRTPRRIDPRRAR